MFRIDRDLVKISPMRFTTVTEAMEPEQEAASEAAGEELAGMPSEYPADESADEAVAPPESEPDIIEPRPSAEELAEGRAAEIISQAGEKAAGLIENAQQRADKLIRMAEEDAEQLRGSARRSGFDAGAAEAKNELEVKKREDDELLRGVIEAIHSERTRMQEEIEGEVIKLTLAVAEKIIKLTNENDDKIFESLIVNALRQMNLEGKITIRVGVQEYDRFFSSGGAVFALGDGTTVTAAVIKDPVFGSGDLIIDSDSGTINAGIDTQLKYIELAFNRADGV